MRLNRLAVTWLCAATTAGCTVDLYGTNGSGGPPTVTEGGIRCDPSLPTPAGQLRRLTSAQYRNTLRDLLAGKLGESGAGTVLSASPALTALRNDEREKLNQDLHGSYRRLDQTLQQARTDSYYQIGLEIGGALLDGGRATTFFGACAADADTGNDAACAEQFIRDFGPKVHRRPLTDEDVAFYVAAFNATEPRDQESFADLVGVMLNAPQLAYMMEHGADPVPGKTETYYLDPYEIASRLSYQIWDSMPDDELFAAAADGSLESEAGFAAQVDRLMASPRARQTAANFIRDWTKGDDLPELDVNNGDPVFQSFAGDELPSASLKEAMIDDAVATADWVIWENSGTVQDLFTTSVNVNRSSELADIYGAPIWDGMSAPASFPDGERTGLLTRAKFLSTGNATTRPVIKGYYIRKFILCDKLEIPENAAFGIPELSPDLTTREVVEALTEQPASSCAPCHGGINPLGYVTENYDALGRLRTAQRLFDEQGNEVGTKPVNTVTVPRLTDSDTTEVHSADELMKLIAAHPKTRACFARSVFRYSMGRWEEDGDGCYLQGMEKQATEGSAADVFRAFLMDPRFRQRVFAQQ